MPSNSEIIDIGSDSVREASLKDLKRIFGSRMLN